MVTHPWAQSGWRCVRGRCRFIRKQLPVSSKSATEWETPPTNASNACCFCWCCCCSCSCLTVRSEDEAIQRTTFEHRPEGATNCEETSLKPTLDDARSWPMSFEKVMKSAAGRACFRQFLRTEFSEENMMFWLACEELKKETNKTVVEEKVRQIYEDFISILSPKEVSLDSRVREVINRNMLEPTSHTFEDAQQQIYTLMQRDSYPRFINSSEYADLLKSLEEPPPSHRPSTATPSFS